MFLDNWMDAYALNQAVWDFGQALEIAISAAEARGKTSKDKEARRKEVLMRWLSPGGSQRKYRDPGAVAGGASKRA